jgi:hypothetical protein
LTEQASFLLPLLRLLKDTILFLFSAPVKIFTQLLISLLLPVQLPLYLLLGPAGEVGVERRAWAHLGKLFTIQMERRGDRLKRNRR